MAFQRGYYPTKTLVCAFREGLRIIVTCVARAHIYPLSIPGPSTVPHAKKVSYKYVWLEWNEIENEVK